jgi:putative transcriptional regulator
MSTRSNQLHTTLTAARAGLGLSQDELARAVGVTRQTISSIEVGQYCPSTVLALRLAAVLETTVESLFHLKETHHANSAHP